MPKKYTSKQFWKLYDKLPQELKDALFAEETGNNIHEICTRCGIEENLGEIVDSVGQVLVGVLASKDFQKTLEKELKLERGLAEKVAQEVDNLIFSPVKESLAKIYGKEIPEKKEKPTAPQKPTYPPGQDTYREPIK